MDTRATIDWTVYCGAGALRFNHAGGIKYARARAARRMRLAQVETNDNPKATRYAGGPKRKLRTRFSTARGSASGEIKPARRGYAQSRL